MVSSNSLDYIEEDVKNFNNLLDCLKSLAENGIAPSMEKKLLSILNQVIPSFHHMILTETFPMIYRLTINRKVIGANKRITEIMDLKYPPANKVKHYGRCNLPGQSVFYATIYGANCHSLVAVNEMGPNVGDLITETTWKVKENQALTYCPIFKNQPYGRNVINPRMFEINQLHEEKVKEYPKNTRVFIDSLIQFVADAFTKRVNPDNHLDYLFSAYFSDKILHKFEDGIIDAIYYPSVKNNLSAENLAIRTDVFENKYELCEVKDSVLIDKSEDGVSAESLSECKNFNFESGEILWDAKIIRQPKERIRKLMDQFGIDLNKSRL